MWIGDEAMNVCTRPDFAGLIASPQRAMSFSFARARPHTVLSLIVRAISCTASKSPLDEAGKPASITSTRSRSSWRAMRSFSSRVIEAPGLCSPSRSVVSKMKRCCCSGSVRCLLMADSGRGVGAKSPPVASDRRCGCCSNWGWGRLAVRGAQQQQAAKKRERAHGLGPGTVGGGGECAAHRADPTGIPPPPQASPVRR